jgi:MoaA/NifB/PqqE/SkfB family radical SAM enzyme
MNSNQGTIFEWYEFLKKELKPDKVNFNYIRPPAADPKELDIDTARYARLSAMIAEDSRRGALKNHYAGDNGFFKAALDIHMHSVIARTQETQRAQLTCYAGTAGGVIYDEGTISSCEILEPVGNLRDFDWNFQKLWFSPAMPGAAQAGRRRLLLHPRAELLLPVAAVQSQTSRPDQTPGARDEERVESDGPRRFVTPVS